MSNHWELKLLGRFTLHHNQMPITDILGAKTQALLSYLAVTGHTYSRSVLAGLLWGGMSEARARGNLSKALSTLRDVVGDHLEITRQSVAFISNDGFWLDVAEFEAGVKHGDLDSLKAAVQLFEEDFLTGFYIRNAPEFEDWVLVQRTRLKADMLKALHTLATHFGTQGEAGRKQAIAYIRDLLRLEPWREEAHRQLMKLLIQDGQRSAALSQYETCQTALDEELGVEPDEETITLYEQIRDGVFDAPPANEPTELRHTAKRPIPPLQRPTRAQHFTSREKELAQILTDLQPGQTVTLCGPGGIGKSALAAEVVWTLAPGTEPPDRFPDGIIFHSFYNQPQVTQALESIALAFGEEPRPTPLAAAQRVLASKQALLVLDGAEDADNLPAMHQVVGRCGVLVTSRSTADAVTDWHDIRPLPAAESVTLLRKWGKEWVSNETEANLICDLIGHLPLAIRLSGRYMMRRKQPAQTFIQGLYNTPLRTLDQGTRRHDSVPILIEQSLCQVTEQARQVLAVIGSLALAPFDVAVIAKAFELSQFAVEDILGVLQDYGLLLRAFNRYEISHALIHTYADRRLVANPEAIDLLLSYYVDLVETESAKALTDYRCLDGERMHLMRLLTNSKKWQDWAGVQRLARVVDGYLSIRGYWIEHRASQEMGLEAAKATSSRKDEGVFLGRLGLAYGHLGEIDRAIDYLQQALAIAQEVSDQRIEGNWLGELGRIYYTLGEMDKAICHYEQALTIAQETGDRRAEGLCLGSIGIAFSVRLQADKAIYHFEQALTIAQEMGDRGNEAAWLAGIGGVRHRLGNLDKAIRYYEQALAINREIGHRRHEGMGLGNIGEAYRELGQAHKAIDYLAQGLQIVQSVKDSFNEAYFLKELGYAYCQLNEYRQARDYFEQALITAETIKSPITGEVQQALGELRRDNASE